jgi:hypothetical protein
MKLAGEAQAELVKLALIGAAAVVVVLMVRRSAAAAGGAIAEALETVASLPGRAVGAVTETAASSYDAVFTPRAGTDGWQFFPMDGVAIDPSGAYWMGTKKIWEPAR